MIRKVIFGIVFLVLIPLLYFVLRGNTYKRVVCQPIAFPHSVHVDRQIDCTFCHDLAERSTSAGIPGVTQCMFCHRSIKTESSEVQKILNFEQKKEEIPWERVYLFRAQAGVYFSHKRHLKAKIDCSRCHGNVAALREMRREIQWTMGKCIDCHRERNVRTDCLTCHK